MERAVNEFRGEKAESYGNTIIYEGFPFFFYEVSEPDFSEDEIILSEALTSIILGKLGTDELDSRYGGVFSVDFVRQFKGDILSDLTDLWVSSDEKTLFLLSGSKIYQISL